MSSLAPRTAFADPAGSATNDPWTRPHPNEPSAPGLPDPNRLPGSTNGTGIIVEPPTNFADARDYPYGMVIRPPKIDQGILIEPSAIQGSLRAVGRGFQDALGAIGKMFQQH